MDIEPVIKSVADPTRRNIMQALLQHELSVNELVAVVRKPQSTVSRHLKVLRDAELIVDRRNGASIHYAPSASALDADRDSLQAVLLRWLAEQPLPKALERRIAGVLDRRHAEAVSYFQRVGHRWERMRSDCFGSRFHLEALTALLPQSWVVADVGTGSGPLLPPLAASFKRVIAIEPVRELLDAARSRPDLAGLDNVDFREGDLRQLPLADGEVDLAVAMLVLHHVPDVSAALREIGRVVKPAGRALVVEQHLHQCEAFRKMMGDRWWGFEPETLAEGLAAAGFEEVAWRTLRTAEPTSASVPETPELFVMTATRKSRKVEKSKSQNGGSCQPSAFSQKPGDSELGTRNQEFGTRNSEPETRN